MSELSNLNASLQSLFFKLNGYQLSGSELEKIKSGLLKSFKAVKDNKTPIYREKGCYGNGACGCNGKCRDIVDQFGNLKHD